MQLSEQQTQIVTGARLNPKWVEVELPKEPFNLPTWLGDVHIDYCLDVGNLPRLLYKVDQNPIDKDLPWERGPEGKYFREKEGVMELLWHRGTLSRREDGKLETTPQDGFGGRNFELKMSDGDTIVLRGPWFGGCPDGWSEMTTVNTYDKHYKADDDKPWWKRGGTFGLFVSDEIKLQAIAKFCPETKVAKMSRNYSVYEPYQAEWGVPKSIKHPGSRK